MMDSLNRLMGSWVTKTIRLMAERLRGSEQIPSEVGIYTLADIAENTGNVTHDTYISLRFDTTNTQVLERVPLHIERTLNVTIDIFAQSLSVYLGQTMGEALVERVTSSIDGWAPLGAGVAWTEPFYIYSSRFVGLTDDSQFHYQMTASATFSSITAIEAEQDICALRGWCDDQLVGTVPDGCWVDQRTGEIVCAGECGEPPVRGEDGKLYDACTGCVIGCDVLPWGRVIDCDGNPDGTWPWAKTGKFIWRLQLQVHTDTVRKEGPSPATAVKDFEHMVAEPAAFRYALARTTKSTALFVDPARPRPLVSAKIPQGVAIGVAAALRLEVNGLLFARAETVDGRSGWIPIGDYMLLSSPTDQLPTL